MMGKHLWLYGYMADFTMPINFAEHEHAREEVMRQHIGGNDCDDIKNMLDDIRHATMPNSPPPADEPDEPHEPDEPGEPEEPEPTVKAFLDMMTSAKEPLYEGEKISQLDAISQLLADKAKHGMTRSCFEDALTIWGNMLPKGHFLPRNMYEAKKIMKALCMDYEKRDCYPAGCLLFRKEFADDKYCSK
jgi:hypothetical protein